MISDVYGKKPSQAVYPAHIVKLVGIVSGSKELYAMAEKGEDVEMCRALDEIKEEGRQRGLSEGVAKGLAEGKVQGRKEGLAEGKALGRTEGLAEGKLQGRTEGINIINKLYSRLLADGRLEDLQRSTQDRSYQMQLISEYQLSENLV